MRLAVIDVGTNSCHLLVADVGADGAISVIEKQREQVELGEGGIGENRLAPAAFRRGLDAMTKFRTALDILDVEAVHTAATSAVREAENGDEFCRTVRARTGISLRVISGREEARLVWLGTRAGIDFRGGEALLLDLGGGSLEFVVCSADEVRVEATLPLGHIRIAERFHRADPFGRDEVAEARAATRRELEKLPKAIREAGAAIVVGTSGSIRSLARMATIARGASPPDHDRGLVLDRAELEAIVRDLTTRRASRYPEMPGFDLKRKRTLPAAAVTLAETMDFLRVDQLVTTDLSLRDGLILEWIRAHRPELALAEAEPDPRRRGVLGMIERYQADSAHAGQVARLALAVFDGLSSIHGLEPVDREILEFGALLHDVGRYIGHEDHHRHGQYLVRNTPMPGLTAPEVALLACLVRYHRGGRPKSTHPEVAALPPRDRRALTTLAGILRIADALDRSRGGLVLDVEVALSRGRVDILARARESAPLERWAALQRADVLASALQREVVVTLAEVGPTG
ncbi:MAG: Ppx/GppA family phosphatase [Deltaproteobacteria bacterium]|nr:Ppx/GppA family phosphatase [Deltaproteobacteria bacterium]